MPHSIPVARFENKIVSSISHLPGTLPTVPWPKELSRARITDIASTFAASLQSATLDHEIFSHDAFWRDQFTLTHNIRTFYSPDAILAAWADVASVARPYNVRLDADTIDMQPAWATVLFTFDADLSDTPAECQGLL